MDHSFGIFALGGTACAKEVLVLDNPEFLAVIETQLFARFDVRRGEKTNSRESEILMIYEHLEKKQAVQSRECKLSFWYTNASLSVKDALYVRTSVLLEWKRLEQHLGPCIRAHFLKAAFVTKIENDNGWKLVHARTFWTIMNWRSIQQTIITNLDWDNVRFTSVIYESGHVAISPGVDAVSVTVFIIQVEKVRVVFSVVSLRIWDQLAHIFAEWEYEKQNCLSRFDLRMDHACLISRQYFISQPGR